MTAVNLSHPSPRNVTDAGSDHTAMTGVTGEPDTVSVTDDRLSLVRRLYARAGEGNGGAVADPSRVTPRRPPWLYDGPLTDRVRITGCNRCRRPVLEALCDTCLPAKADLIRLTPAAELRHLLAGGYTVRLWPDRPDATVLHLAFRQPWHIRAHPGRGLPVHDCALTHGPNDPTILAARRRATLPEEPPF